MAKKVVRFSLILSLLLHVLTGLGLWLTKPPQKKIAEVIEVDFRNIEPEKRVETPENKAKQIVDQRKQFNDEVDPNAKYLSQFNQKVMRETKAANNGDFRNLAGPHSNGPGKGQEQKKANKKNTVSKTLFAEQKTKSGLPTLESLKPKFEWDNLSEKNQVAGASGSQTDDYLKDTDVSNETLLSTREFLYYSYYNRIKAQLKQYWEPKLKERVTRLFQRGRRIASTGDRITKVIIFLDKKGNLTKVQIVGESGIQDLDEAAVDAFRAAAPFPNPPKGIIDPDGTIKIRWDFVLESAALDKEMQPTQRRAVRL